MSSRLSEENLGAGAGAQLSPGQMMDVAACDPTAPAGRSMPGIGLSSQELRGFLLRRLPEAPPPAEDTLVPIRSGGSRRALFLVSRPSVHARAYLALARHLGPDRPVFGLQCQSPDEEALGRPYTHDEYEAWSTRCLQTLRRVQPKGPYLLGGWGEGALIAFRMTRQLEALGHRVRLLAMLDAWPEENTQHGLRRWVWGCESRFRRFAQSGLRAQLGVLGSKAAQLSRGDPGARAEVEANPWRRRVFPGPHFVPAQVSCRITALRVQRQPYWRIRDAELGWGSRSVAGVDVHEIAGEHGTLLREPHVRDLAACLDACLERAEETIAVEDALGIRPEPGGP